MKPTRRTSFNSWLRLTPITMLALLASCSPQGAREAPPSTGAQTGAVTPSKVLPGPIALVVKTLANPFFLTMQEGARRAAEEHGIDLRVQAPAREGDIARQTQFLMDDITQGF